MKIYNHGGSPRETADWEAAGHEVITVGPKDPSDPRVVYTPAELGELCHDADVMLAGIRERIYSGELMDRTPKLRMFGTGGIGVHTIDSDAATERGILVVNSPSEEWALGVAESTILLMLAMNKRLRRIENTLINDQTDALAWQPELMSAQTIGIVGFGRIGRYVADRLRTWGCRILMYDPYVSEVPGEFQGVVEQTDFDTLLAESDQVSLHVVLTEETYHLMNADTLAKMKPSAVLINTARGANVDAEAFADAVERDVIWGGALDTFEDEPLALDSRLRGLDRERVILTPHRIGVSRQGWAGNQRLLVQSVFDAMAGKVPGPVTNRDAIPKWLERFGGG